MILPVNLTRTLSQRSYQALIRNVSSQPLSEASEALQHVNEAEKQEVEVEKPALKGTPPKLDREKNLNMTYSIASTDKLKEVNKLLYATYHPDEPITKHLGLYKGPNSIPDADRMVAQIVPRHLSLFAFDKKGEVIGVCVNNACFKSDFLQEDLEFGLG